MRRSSAQRTPFAAASSSTSNVDALEIVAPHEQLEEADEELDEGGEVREGMAAAGERALRRPLDRAPDAARELDHRRGAERAEQVQVQLGLGKRLEVVDEAHGRTGLRVGVSRAASARPV